MSGYIDTRDLDAELTELEDLERIDADPDDDGGMDEESRERLDALRALRDEIGAEWSYGATLIREDKFEDYARELAMDYTTVEWEGDTYYVRA